MSIKNCSNLFILGVILGIVGVISAGILAWFNSITKPLILESTQNKVNQALAQVLPQFDNVPSENCVEVDGIKFYGATQDGNLVGIVAEGETSMGYAGVISGLVGLTPSGEIAKLKGDRSAILITNQNETPGLGTNVCNRTTVKTLKTLFSKEKQDTTVLPSNKVLDSFNGMGINDIPVKIIKDGGKVEFISGATVTSRAVADLVNNVLVVYKDNEATILSQLQNGGK